MSRVFLAPFLPALGPNLNDMGEKYITVFENRDNLEKVITLEVKQSYLNLQAAKEAISTAQENVGQAEKAFEIIETRYKNGLATNLEFLDAQLASLQARTNYLSAVKNYYTSRAEIYKAIGKED